MGRPLRRDAISGASSPSISWGDPQTSEGLLLTPTLSCARTSPVWFENWTEFTASISNPKTCKTERRTRLKSLPGGSKSQQVPDASLEASLEVGGFRADVWLAPGTGARTA